MKTFNIHKLNKLRQKNNKTHNYYLNWKQLPGIKQNWWPGRARIWRGKVVEQKKGSSTDLRMDWICLLSVVKSCFLVGDLFLQDFCRASSAQKRLPGLDPGLGPLTQYGCRCTLWVPLESCDKMKWIVKTVSWGCRPVFSGCTTIATWLFLFSLIVGCGVCGVRVLWFQGFKVCWARSFSHWDLGWTKSEIKWRRACSTFRLDFKLSRLSILQPD